jgi:hypothetical protein
VRWLIAIRLPSARLFKIATIRVGYRSLVGQVADGIIVIILIDTPTRPINAALTLTIRIQMWELADVFMNLAHVANCSIAIAVIHTTSRRRAHLRAGQQDIINVLQEGDVLHYAFR